MTPIFTVVAEPGAVREWQALDVDRATAVLNNIVSLARTPHPRGSMIERGPDDLLYRHVGDADVIYEIIGQTVRILGLEPRPRRSLKASLRANGT